MNAKTHIARAATAWLIGASACAGAFAQTTTASGVVPPCTDAVPQNGVSSGTLGAPSTQLGSNSAAGAAMPGAGSTSTLGAGASLFTPPRTGVTPSGVAAPGLSTAGPNLPNTTPALNSGTTIAGSASGAASLQPNGCR